VFRRGELPVEMPLYRTSHARVNVVDLLVDAGLVRSRSQARRLVEQGGVRVDGDRVESAEVTIPVDDGTIVQVGKRRFVRLGREA
jgi:tyrosyl-tRNA synthetase